MRRKKHGRRDFRILCIAAMSVCIPAARPAQAQTAIWNGGAGNWNNAALWNNGVVPNDAAVDVAIDSGNFATSVVNLNISATARTISIDAGDTLQYSKQKSLYLTGGGTFNGNVNMVALVQMMAVGSQTFGGTGQINLTGNNPKGGGGSIIVGTADGSTPAMLTLGAGLVVRGAAGFIGTDLWDGSRVVNQGMILSEFNPRISTALTLKNVVNQGMIRSDGTEIEAFNFQNDATGVVTAVNGSYLGLNFGMTNSGRIDVSDSTLAMRFSPAAPGSLAVSSGTITAHNSQLILVGTFSHEDLNSIHRSGTGSTTFGGTLLNTGNTLALNAITGNLLLDSARIVGGTITAADGASINLYYSPGYSSTLEGNVVLGADVRIGQGILEFTGGLTMAGSTIRFRTQDSHMSFTGLDAISGSGTVDLENTAASILGLSPGSILEIGPGIHVRGTFASIGGSIGGSIENAFILNRGTITADAGPGGLSLLNATNLGSVEVSAGGTMGVTNFSQAAGSLRVNGRFASNNDVNLSGGVLSGTGSINLVINSNVANLFIGGNLAPGNSIGTLSVTGCVTLTGTGHYTAQLQGANSADLLAVDGDLNLGIGSTLDIASLGSLVNGNNYLIATYTGALTGTFTQVTAGFEISYATPHEIRVTPIPEPGMVWWLGTSLAIITLGRRQSRIARSSSSSLPLIQSSP